MPQAPFRSARGHADGVVRRQRLAPLADQHAAAVELDGQALTQLDADRLQDALPMSRRAAKIVIDRLVASSGNGLGLSASTLASILDTNLDLLQRAAANGQDTAAEAFEIVQRAN